MPKNELYFKKINISELFIMIIFIVKIKFFNKPVLYFKILNIFAMLFSQ